MAGGRVALRVGAGLVLLAFVLAVARPALVSPWARRSRSAWSSRSRRRRRSPVHQLLSSLLVGPLIVGVAVRPGGRTAAGLERLLGVAVRHVGLPVFLGLAALHTDLRELHAGVLGGVLGLLAAVIAIKAGAGYAAARVARFPAPTRAPSAPSCNAAGS